MQVPTLDLGQLMQLQVSSSWTAPQCIKLSYQRPEGDRARSQYKALQRVQSLAHSVRERNRCTVKKVDWNSRVGVGGGLTTPHQPLNGLLFILKSMQVLKKIGIQNHRKIV